MKVVCTLEERVDAGALPFFSDGRWYEYASSEEKNSVGFFDVLVAHVLIDSSVPIIG